MAEPTFDNGLVVAKAKVVLFKPSGKYYTEEEWEIPTDRQVLIRGGSRGDSVLPYCMKFSKDFRRIDNGPVLVVTQEPWGYPHIFVSPYDGTGEGLPAVDYAKGPPF